MYSDSRTESQFPVTALIFYTRSSRRYPNKELRRRFEHQPVESKCTGTSAGNYTITVTAKCRITCEHSQTHHRIDSGGAVSPGSRLPVSVIFVHHQNIGIHLVELRIQNVAAVRR
jgi:hypothetical protein